MIRQTLERIGEYYCWLCIGIAAAYYLAHVLAWVIGG